MKVLHQADQTVDFLMLYCEEWANKCNDSTAGSGANRGYENADSFKLWGYESYLGSLALKRNSRKAMDLLPEVSTYGEYRILCNFELWGLWFCFSYSKQSWIPANSFVAPVLMCSAGLLRIYCKQDCTQVKWCQRPNVFFEGNKLFFTFWTVYSNTII